MDSESGQSIPVADIKRLLEQDVLQNLVTLKMLHLYADSLHFEARQDASGWGLLTLLPVLNSEWDRKTYPDCKYVAFVNGSSPSAMRNLLGCLPNDFVVLKVSNNVLPTHRNAVRTLTFHSFTAAKTAGHLTPDIIESTTPDEGAWRMFQSNGYDRDELDHYFRQGARWFGIRRDDQLASACFVFRNYKQIWEIAGVCTLPDYRRQGLAHNVVTAALKHLVATSLTPRYQCRSDNIASLHLAASCGLTEFLQMHHYLLTPS